MEENNDPNNIYDKLVGCFLDQHEILYEEGVNWEQESAEHKLNGNDNDELSCGTKKT